MDTQELTRLYGEAINAAGVIVRLVGEQRPHIDAMKALIRAEGPIDIQADLENDRVVIHMLGATNGAQIGGEKNGNLFVIGLAAILGMLTSIAEDELETEAKQHA